MPLVILGECKFLHLLIHCVIENSWYCLSLQTQRQQKFGWRCTNFPGMLGWMSWSLSWQRKRRNQYAMNCVPTCTYCVSLWYNVGCQYCTYFDQNSKTFSLFFKIKLVFIRHQLLPVILPCNQVSCKVWNSVEYFFLCPIASVCELWE